MNDFEKEYFDKAAMDLRIALQAMCELRLDPTYKDAALDVLQSAINMAKAGMIGPLRFQENDLISPPSSSLPKPAKRRIFIRSNEDNRLLNFWCADQYVKGFALHLADEFGIIPPGRVDGDFGLLVSNLYDLVAVRNYIADEVIRKFGSEYVHDA